MRRHSSPSSTPRHRRGIALLLVMIALVIGTTLTAGYLLTQSTSVGIALNARDSEKARLVAESGIDMCLWQIKYNTNWRTAMNPGKWLNAYSLAGGTVTVSAAETAGNANFTTNYANGVTLTSIGTVNGRTCTVTATAVPTGGGTPFANGIFSNGDVTLSAFSVIDSYNATGNSAILSTNSNDSGALRIDLTSSFTGSLIGGIDSLVTSLVNLLFPGTGPSSISAASTPHITGSVIFPNTAGFNTPTTAFNKSSAGLTTLPLSGGTNPSSTAYTNFTATAGTVNATSGSTYYITGNFTLSNSATLALLNSGTTTFIVNGNVNISSNINYSNANAKLAIFAGGNITINSAIGSSTQGPAALMLYGGQNCCNVTIDGKNSNIKIYADILAPAAATTIKANAELFGNDLTNTLTLSTGKLHMDASSLSLPVHNFTGGSYMGDYAITWQQ